MPAPRFGKHCYFSEGAVIVGDVEMGDDCTVWFNAVVRGDVHFIKIGNRTNIQDNSCIHTLNGKAPCILGDDVTIGHSVTLHGCEVKDGALIGMGATVLDHAVVGKGAIVAAGALVLSNTQIGDGELWGGVPAKFIKFKWTIDEILEHESKLFPEEERYTREQLEKIFKSQG